MNDFQIQLTRRELELIIDSINENIHDMFFCDYDKDDRDILHDLRKELSRRCYG